MGNAVNVSIAIVLVLRYLCIIVREARRTAAGVRSWPTISCEPLVSRMDSFGNGHGCTDPSNYR